MSVFDDTIPERAVCEAVSPKMDFWLAYTTIQTPENLAAKKNVLRYKAQLEGEHP
jgi:hypothetical protein